MTRMHLQTIPEALREQTKIIIAPGVGVPELWMGAKGFFPVNSLGDMQK